MRAAHVPAAAALLVNAVHNYALMETLGAHDRAHEAAAIRGALAALWAGLAPGD